MVIINNIQSQRINAQPVESTNGWYDLHARFEGNLKAVPTPGTPPSLTSSLSTYELRKVRITLLKKSLFWACMGKLGIVFSSQLQWITTRNFRLSMLPSSSRIEAGEALALGATVTLWSHLRASLATRRATRAQNKAGAEFQNQGEISYYDQLNWT